MSLVSERLVSTARCIHLGPQVRRMVLGQPSRGSQLHSRFHPETFFKEGGDSLKPSVSVMPPLLPIIVHDSMPDSPCIAFSLTCLVCWAVLREKKRMSEAKIIRTSSKGNLSEDSGEKSRRSWFGRVLLRSVFEIWYRKPWFVEQCVQVV